MITDNESLFLPIETTDKWLIIGAGAIGLLWYSKLYCYGCDVTLLHRYHSMPHTLKVIENESNKKNDLLLNSLNLRDIKPDHLGLFNHIIICTKSFDLLQAYQEAQPLFSETANILCLCNGLGVQQALATRLNKEQQLFVGVTSEGVLKIDNASIQKTGNGDTFFGLLPPPNQPINQKALLPKPLNRLQVTNIEEKLFLKIAINAVINPLTALFNIRNGELLNASYARLFELACDEVEYFMTAAYPYKTNYKKLTKEVAKATKNNCSSMLQDYSHGRKTEIESICGYLIDQAVKLNQPLPIQAILFKALTGDINEENAKKQLLTL